LNQFLFKYQKTPQTTTGLSPAEMLFGCRLRSHLDLLISTVASRVQANQHQQKTNHDDKHEFDIGDAVYVKNFSGSPAWVPEKCRDPLSYLVRLPNNKVVRRHVDHIKIRLSNNKISNSDDKFLLIVDQASSPVVEQSNTTEVLYLTLSNYFALQEYNVLLIVSLQKTLHLDEGGDLIAWNII